ncbi:MAG: AmmeMemoRadiSam system protein B, partial [Brevinematales bacterium]
AEVDERLTQDLAQKIGLPFALISPHAGYVYSGQVAAYGYKLIEHTNWDVVVLLGPSHYVHFEGAALSSAMAFQTPLGEIDVHQDYNAALIEEDPHLFSYLSSAHEREHCLETQLPFLQDVVEGEFRMVPILLGALSRQSVLDMAKTLVTLYRRRNERVLFVISTDLSHYHSAKEAKEMDRRLIRHLLAMDTEALMRDAFSGVIEACGIFPLLVMCEMAKQLGRTQAKELCYRHSGEVSGDYRQVVGYLSAVVW